MAAASARSAARPDRDRNGGCGQAMAPDRQSVLGSARPLVGNRALDSEPRQHQRVTDPGATSREEAPWLEPLEVDAERPIDVVVDVLHRMRSLRIQPADPWTRFAGR